MGGRAEAHGTCWHECRCDGAGTCTYNDNECVDFTCDSGKWRRQAQQDACVRDACTRVRLSSDLFLFPPKMEPVHVELCCERSHQKSKTAAV